MKRGSLLRITSSASLQPSSLVLPYLNGKSSRGFASGKHGLEEEERLKNALASLRAGPIAPPSPTTLPPLAEPRVRKLDIFEITKLWPEWKDMVKWENLKADIASGMTVSMVNLPLALGIALASHVPPLTGIVSSVVAGAMAAFFGGARYAVTGPAAACALLVASIVDKYGLSAMVASTLVVGGLQIGLGVTKLGGACKYIPLPVVTGFTSGIGAVIALKQLPACLVTSPNDIKVNLTLNTDLPAHFLEYATQMFSNLHFPTIALSSVAIASCLFLPKILPKAPASLIGIGAATGLQLYFQFPGIELLGSLPAGLPSPSLPSLTSILDPKMFPGWAGQTFLLFGLCSIETLLSQTASDKLLTTRGINYRHDPHLDMKGQGLANMVSACFGGIASTAVIVRSSANILSGARSRASALIVSGVTLAGVAGLQDVLSQLPVCALSGVLVAVGTRMIRNNETQTVLRLRDWTETVPMASAFSLLVAHDLLTGVACGVVTSTLILGTQRLYNKVPLTFRWDWLLRTAPRGVEIVGLEIIGSLTFLSLARLEEMVRRLNRKHILGMLCKQFKVDCSKIVLIDLTSMERFLSVLDDLVPFGYQIQLIGLPNRIEEAFLRADPHAKRYFP